MASSVKSSIIVVLLIGILLEISGNGVFDIIKCSEIYNYKRCLKIGNDNPENLMNDFYSSVKGNNPRAINPAWNLLSEDLQERYENIKEGIKGKNYFYNFWGDEVNKFVRLNTITNKKNKFITDMTFDICYLRSKEYAEKYKKPYRFCSKDTYRLIKKREKDSPYLWSMDTYKREECKSEEEKMCMEYNF